MQIRHNPIKISKNNPFENCKLDREKFAPILTDIIQSTPEGFVMAINNQWGAGKTTFIKMWKAYLKKEGFQTLYFNAWENDFESNPIIPILSELKKLNNKKSYESLIDKGGKIVKSVIPALAAGIVRGIAQKYIDSAAINDIISETTDAGKDVLKEEIEEYQSKKENLKEFRKELRNYLKSNNTDNPVVFIVDELDRCRPNYAVEVLEYIKHFFNVEGIVFVLSIDKEQLGNSIRGVYGTDLLDSENYLKRFIDIEYSLPDPNANLYCKYLIDYYQYDEFFKDRDKVYGTDIIQLMKFASGLFKTKNLSLRSQEKILAHTRIAMNSFHKNTLVLPTLFIYLVYLKTNEASIFTSINSKKIGLDELLTQYAKTTTDIANMNSRMLRHIVFIEALLLYLYNNYLDESRKELFKFKDGSIEYYYYSKIDNTNKAFHETLRSFSNDRMISDTSLNYLLDKVNLIEGFANQREI